MVDRIVLIRVGFLPLLVCCWCWGVSQVVAEQNESDLFRVSLQVEEEDGQPASSSVSIIRPKPISDQRSDESRLFRSTVRATRLQRRQTESGNPDVPQHLRYNIFWRGQTGKGTSSNEWSGLEHGYKSKKGASSEWGWPSKGLWNGGGCVTPGSKTWKSTNSRKGSKGWKCAAYGPNGAHVPMMKMMMKMDMMHMMPMRPSRPMNRPSRNPADSFAPTVTAEPTSSPTSNGGTSTPNLTPNPTSSTPSPTNVNSLTTLTGGEADNETMPTGDNEKYNTPQEGHSADLLSDVPSDLPTTVPTYSSALQQHQITIH